MEKYSIIISIALSVITIFVPIVTYKLDRKNAKIKEQKETENKAKIFILNNSSEKEYICLALIAAYCFPQNNHIRKIYNDFSLLNNDVKNEVLKQLDINPVDISGIDWVYNRIELLQKAIKKMELGDDFLYGGAKYFHKLYDHKNTVYNHSWLTVEKYDDVFGIDRIMIGKNGKVSFSRYIDDYLYCKYEDKNKFSSDWIKPLDYMIEIEDLRNTSEETVCFWISEEILESMQYAKKYLGYIILEHNYSYAKIETFEDRYFEVIYELYFFREPNIIRKSKK